MQRNVAASGLATVVFIAMAAVTTWFVTGIGHPGQQLTIGDSGPAAQIRLHGTGK